MNNGYSDTYICFPYLFEVTKLLPLENISILKYELWKPGNRDRVKIICQFICKMLIHGHFNNGDQNVECQIVGC